MRLVSFQHELFVKVGSNTPNAYDKRRVPDRVRRIAFRVPTAIFTRDNRYIKTGRPGRGEIAFGPYSQRKFLRGRFYAVCRRYLRHAVQLGIKSFGLRLIQSDELTAVFPSRLPLVSIPHHPADYAKSCHVPHGRFNGARTSSFRQVPRVSR